VGIELHCPDGPSSTGAYRLEWSGPPDAVFTLEQDGRVLYSGSDQATTVSGQPRGRYSYRLTATGAPTSASCTVEVQPPSMALALSLFAVGLVVFVATLLLVVRGHRAHRRGEL